MRGNILACIGHNNSDIHYFCLTPVHGKLNLSFLHPMEISRMWSGLQPLNTGDVSGDRRYQTSTGEMGRLCDVRAGPVHAKRMKSFLRYVETGKARMETQQLDES